MTKFLLITGATGKQGGAVIEALLSQKTIGSEFAILAVSRDIKSPGATELVTKFPSVRLVQGNLDDAPLLFMNALKISSYEPVWGVYSVQVSQGRNVTLEREVKQGIDLFDESIKRGVKHFVYSSVERGGDVKSWDNSTPISHFQSKHRIEQHIRSAAEGRGMGWTILRPVALMENFQPGFATKVFLTALRDSLDGRAMQLVAVRDVGVFAMMAFENPEEWNRVAIGLAGDELDFAGISDVFKEKTGREAGTTFGVWGSLLKWAISDMGLMLNWFKTDGYSADIKILRQMHPGLMDFGAWLERSKFEIVGGSGK